MKAIALLYALARRGGATSRGVDKHLLVGRERKPEKLLPLALDAAPDAG